ncbi:O-antigen ligase family protein [Rufibacter soli]
MKLRARLSVSLTAVSLLLVFLLFSGFITNFLSFKAISLSTLAVDSLVFFMLGHFVLVVLWGYYNRATIKKDYFLFACLWFFLLVASLLKVALVDTNPLGERLLGLRNNLFYCSFLLYIPLLFNKEQANRSIINVMLGLGLLLCLFAIFQFTFSAKLPLSMLALRGEGVFTFFNKSLVRPTALLGNTIIFSSFTIILFSFFLIRYLHTKGTLYLVFMAIACTANFLTYTRAALVGLALAGGTVLFLHYGKLSLQFIIKIFLVVAVALSAVLLVGYLYKDSFLVRRVTGTEASTVSSTNQHFEEINSSIDYLRKHPWAGAGIGTQGPGGNIEHKIITDGYWFQLFLENGFVLGLFFLAFYFISFLYALFTLFSAKDPFLKELCIAFVAFSVYFYLANFINSAFVGRVNFILYWVIFSIILAQNFIVKDRNHALASH